MQTIIELELAGRGNGWTDVSSDVRLPVEVDYGINGTGVNDRVASTGFLNFQLQSANGTTGYYSPNHANKRAGFALGVRARLSFVVGGVTIRKFVGKVTEIVPVGGREGAGRVRISAVDWMDDAASQTATGLTLLENVRGDQAFNALLAVVSEQPNAIEVAAVGQDIYKYAFDNSDSQSVSVLSELQRLANSEGGYIYIKGDPAVGGVLVYESRTVRGRTTSNVVTFTDTNGLTQLDAAQARANIANRMRLGIHPREIDALATSVLYQLRNSIKIDPLTAFRLIGSYYDPLQRAQKVGGRDVTVQSWAVNANSDGSGADLTANFTLAVSYGPNGFSALLTNNASAVGHLVTFILQGRGIYDYTDVVVESSDPASIANHGERVAKLDQPYQSDAYAAYDLSLYLLNLWKDPATQVQRAQITCGTDNDALLLAILQREPSHRIGIVEEYSGINTLNPNASGARGFFIHRLRYSITESAAHGAVVAEFSLAPGDASVFWVLELPGASEMNDTTRLAFYSAVGHIDTAHTDVHGDAAHADVAHSDTHTDTPHTDAAHADAAHSDVAHTDAAHQDSHGDTAHADVVHSDAAHADSHGDVVHSDVVHSDVVHSDVAHSDVAHNDVAHSDTAHSDTLHLDDPHQDSHSDVAHSDFPYSDVAHGDTAHDDSHFDTHSDVHNDAPDDPPHGDTHGDTHGDVVHSDVAHSDTHTDTPHGDTHDDEAHEDAPHSDVVHADSHSDAAHSDVTHSDAPHSDSHTDTVHSDTHNDTAHADVAHSDTAHADAAHADTVHADAAHADAGHSDAAHADVAHNDVVHSDTNHSDTPHGDTHDDVTHGDS